MNDNLSALKEAIQQALASIKEIQTLLIKQEAEAAAMRAELVRRDKASISLRYPFIKWHRL
jgi:hypothetical protein